MNRFNGLNSLLLDSVKGLCVICNNHVYPPGNVTCSSKCHEEFVKLCGEKFGVFKKVIDETTNITYKVPTRDIIEKGLKWEELAKYPVWREIMKEFVIELDDVIMKDKSYEEVKNYIDQKLWQIVAETIKIEDKSFVATGELERSDIYIYSPGWPLDVLPKDMSDRLEKARKLNKKIARVEILYRDRISDKTILKVRVTEE